MTRMNNERDLTEHERQLLEKLEQILSDNSDEQREVDSLYGFCAHLASVVPQAQHSFRQQLENRLVVALQQGEPPKKQPLYRFARDPFMPQYSWKRLRWALTLTVFAVVSLLIIGAGVIVIASGIINPVSPSNLEEVQKAVLASAITVPPPGLVAYTAVHEGEITSPDGRPVAMLNDNSARLFEEISVYFSDNNTTSVDSQPEAITFLILSSVKYSVNNNDTLVTTTQPSHAISTRSVLLGAREVELSNGVTAWATEFTHDEFPNRVIFLDDNLLITVASVLPIEEVQRLATDVIVK
jgi:hypothetical protein